MNAMAMKLCRLLPFLPATAAAKINCLTRKALTKKVERIIKMQPDALHLSNCTMPKDENGNRVICPVIKELEDKFTAAGIDVVRGTH